MDKNFAGNVIATPQGPGQSLTTKKKLDTTGKDTWVFWCLFLIMFFTTMATLLATDGTPDFKIYHYYNGFAAHHNRTALDIFPAQLQTTLFPGLDAIYYPVFRTFNRYPRIVNIILSVPYSCAAVIIFFFARLFITANLRARNLTCSVLALFGLTGSASLPTLATTMSDIAPGVLILFALVLWLYCEQSDRHSGWKTVIIGLCAGASVGLKLTLAPVFIGLSLAVVAKGILGRREAFRQALALSTTGLLAYLALDGHWLLSNYRHYGNPLFPFLNQIFKSDLVNHAAWTDLRFMPRSEMIAIFYPAYWAFRDSHLAIELNMRDARILIGVVSATALIVHFALRRIRTYHDTGYQSQIEVLGFYAGLIYLSSYLLWEKVWSIYRYLALQESLSGAMLAIALLTIFGRRVQWFWIAIMIAAITLPSAWATHYPWWSRARRGPQAISVHLPAIEPNAMVLFLDPYAYSYLVPSFPRSVRALGVNSNLVRPGSWGLLQPQIEAAIRGHSGPLWGMEYPEAFPGGADRTLAYYHMVRDHCSLIDTNIEDHPLVRMCRLRRQY